MKEEYSEEEWREFLTELDLEESQWQHLMQSQDVAENFFNELQSNLSSELSSNLDIKLPVGYQVGNYKVAEEIGRGGMALVYKANRADALFDQEVAIKLLSPVLNSVKYEDYFRSERQLLASLNHPNIAKIFDGGMTQDQIPYFIMEYIDGIAIDQYCKRKKLGANQIIKNVISVCEAVQHAHNNFILHRDIKPSNVLLTSDGEIKLLDFGIGKLLDAPNEQDVSFGGTLKYASPEQLNHEHLSTQSDIYQIGVLLYELLTERTPFPGENRTAIIEAIKTGNFNTPKVVAPSVSMDLNTIILKCMAINAPDRYLSVTAIINDLNNYLTHFPVSAKRQNWRYTTRLFLQRNILTASLVAMVILISIGATIITQIQIDETEQERKKVSAANAFLTKIFEANDPDYTQGEDIRVAELLKNSEKEINNITDPEVKAYTQNQLGELYKKIGLWKESGPLFFGALDNYLSHHPNNHSLDIANTYGNISGYYRDISEYDKADSTGQLAINMLQNLRADHPLALAISHKEHAYISYLRGEYLEGEKEAKYAVDLIEDVMSSNHEEKGHEKNIEIELAYAYSTLSSNLRELSKYEEALKAIKITLAIGEKFENEDIRLKLNALSKLSIIYNRLGQYDQQIEMLINELKTTLRVYGTENPSTISCYTNLATAYYSIKDYQKSDSLGQLAYELSLKKFGSFHNQTITILYNLSNSMIDQKKYSLAQEYLEKVLNGDIENFGEDHPYVAGDYISLGIIHSNLGSYNYAENYYSKAYKIYSEKFGQKHKRLSYLHSCFGDLYGLQNMYGKSKSHYDKAIAIAKELLGTEHPDYKQYVKEWEQIHSRLK